MGIVGKPKWAKITADQSNDKVLSDGEEELDLLKVNSIKI